LPIRGSNSKDDILKDIYYQNSLVSI